MNGILLFIDDILKLIELHLSYTSTPEKPYLEMTTKEEKERENSVVIIQHLFIVLDYFTQEHSTVKDYAELFIVVASFPDRLIPSRRSPAFLGWLFPPSIHSTPSSVYTSSPT